MMPPTQRMPTCRYINKPNGCQNSKCKFFHPAPDRRGVRGIKREYYDPEEHFQSFNGTRQSKERKVSIEKEEQHGSDTNENGLQARLDLECGCSFIDFYNLRALFTALKLFGRLALERYGCAGIEFGKIRWCLKYYFKRSSDDVLYLEKSGGL